MPSLSWDFTSGFMSGVSREPPPVSDIDAALAQTDDGPPDDVEARVDRHLSLLHGWLDAAGPPPRQDAPV